jgi:hypothetical protein
VLRRRQVRVRSGTASRGEFDHLRAERRDRPAVLRHSILVKLVEVLSERVVRLLVFGVRLRMPDADTQQEAAGVGLVDPVVRLGDGAGIGCPDVHDAGRQLQRVRRAENGIHPIQFGRR